MCQYSACCALLKIHFARAEKAREKGIEIEIEIEIEREATTSHPRAWPPWPGQRRRGEATTSQAVESRSAGVRPVWSGATRHDSELNTLKPEARCLAAGELLHTGHRDYPYSTVFHPDYC
jgi:hypothetical protein